MRFLGGRLIRGFLILLPAILSYLLVGASFEMMLALTIPITDVLPDTAFPDVVIQQIVALVILAALCLVAGVAAESALARRFGLFVETQVLTRFTPYRILKSLARRLSGNDVPDKLEPALLLTAPETQVLAFIVEQHEDGRLTVFVPLGSTPGVGQIQIVGAGRIERLDVSMMDALGCLFNWGDGAEALVAKRRPVSP